MSQARLLNEKIYAECNVAADRLDEAWCNSDDEDEEDVL
jgi:hypothetical protein